jgi:hypothetical protein
MGQKRRPSQPRRVSFRQLRTLVRASIRWSSRPVLLSADHGTPREDCVLDLRLRKRPPLDKGGIDASAS